MTETIKCMFCEQDPVKDSFEIDPTWNAETYEGYMVWRDPDGVLRHRHNFSQSGFQKSVKETKIVKKHTDKQFAEIKDTLYSTILEWQQDPHDPDAVAKMREGLSERLAASLAGDKSVDRLLVTDLLSQLMDPMIESDIASYQTFRRQQEALKAVYKSGGVDPKIAETFE